jgi:hypothetical protein
MDMWMIGLQISERTVKEIHVNLVRKWNVRTVSPAIDYAQRNELMILYELAISKKKA